MKSTYSLSVLLAIGTVSLGVAACGGRGGGSPVPVPADGSGFAGRVAAKGAHAAAAGPAAHVVPGDRRPLALVQVRRRGATPLQSPIADEALQVGHAYPNHEHWSYSGIDSSCGELDWSYENKIPGATVTVDPQTSALDGTVTVAYAQIPDDTPIGVYENTITATCSNAKATGRLPGPTPYTIATVSLDIATVPQDSGDGTNVTNKTFTTFVGKFTELDASPEPEVTLLQNTWKLPGDTVKTYTQTKTKASYAMLDAGDLAQQQLNFYWIHDTAGKALPLPLSVVFPVFNSHCAPDGCSGSEAFWGLADAEASVQVDAPTVTAMTSTTYGVAVDAKDGRFGCVAALNFGFQNAPGHDCDPPGSLPGISWRMSARVPIGGDGDLDATQFIRRADSVAALAGAHAVPTAYPGTNGTYELDGCLREGNTTSVHQPIASGGAATYEGSDSPGFILHPQWSTLDAEDSYITDFVYKPTDERGTEPDRLNIWVPLGSLRWAWQGVATQTAPVWHLKSSNHTVNPEGTYASPEPLPTWNAFYAADPRTCPPGG
jgi:hypothetical protein